MTTKAIGSRSLNAIMKYHLRANSTYVIGKPIIITFTLENLKDEDLWILTWYTPLEGFKGKIFLVICDGEEILYEGRMVRRGDPVRNDYVRIRSRSSLTTEVDLSLAYNLPVAEECKVTFKGRIYDTVDSEDRLPRKNDEHRGFYISGEAVTFRVVTSSG